MSYERETTGRERPSPFPTPDQYRQYLYPGDREPSPPPRRMRRGAVPLMFVAGAIVVALILVGIVVGAKGRAPTNSTPTTIVTSSLAVP